MPEASIEVRAGRDRVTVTVRVGDKSARIALTPERAKRLAVDRGLAVLGPTEREKELERHLGRYKSALDALASQRNAEPAGDLLTVEPLSPVERDALVNAGFIFSEDDRESEQAAIASVLARFPLPKPAPADPLQALLAAWRERDSSFGSDDAADELEAALAQRESDNA